MKEGGGRQRGWRWVAGAALFQRPLTWHLMYGMSSGRTASLGPPTTLPFFWGASAAASGASEAAAAASSSPSSAAVRMGCNL